MIFSVDAYQRLDRPFTYLATPNKDYIGIIQSRDLSNDLCFNNISETSFKVNKYEDGEPTPNYDSIDMNMLVEITYVGWFQITDVEKQGDGNNESLTITALSLENEACSKTLTSFGQLGIETDEQGGLDRYCLSDITDISHSILHIWLEKMPSWKIGFIDPEITKEYRTFSEDEVAAYSFLVDKVSETFECIFQFDTFEQTVSAYKLKNIGELTDIYLSYENIIKNISVKSNNSDIKTVLTVTGGDDRGTPLGIIEVNPSGTNQIYDFSYYKHLMSQELQIKLDAYEIEYSNRLNNFTPAITQLQSLCDELDILKNKVSINGETIVNSESIKLIQTYQGLEKTRKDMGTNFVGNVDINNRPIVINDDGSYSTSLTSFQEYWRGNGATGHYEIIHFTPILSNGTILSDDTLYNYLDNISIASDILTADKSANGGLNIIYKVDTTYKGTKITDTNLQLAFSVADIWDVEMHDTQNAIYEQEANSLIKINNLAKKSNMTLESYIVFIMSTNWTEYGLAELNAKYNYYNERMSLYIGKNDSTSLTNYNSNHALRDDVESELKIRRSQIATKETEIVNQKLLCESIKLNLPDYLGTTLYKELSRYVHEDTFTDDTFVVTEVMTDADALEMKRGLLKMAKEKLAKVCKPSYSIEVDAINFTTIPEFANFTQQLYLGNIITLDFGDDILVESRLLKLHINWDNPSDFSMTFSSKNKLDGFEYEFAEIQSQASAAGSAYGFNGTGWNNAKNKTNTFSQYMTSTLDLAKQKLQSSTNQEFTADSTGTLWKKWLEDQNDYSPNQMWGTGNGLYLSQNKWNTVSMAIGEGEYNGQTIYGIWAPLICGQILVSEKLAIANSSGTYAINDNGFTATNDIYSVGINPNTPSEILNVKVNGDNKLYVDTINNKVVFKGHIEAESGKFSGEIFASTININNNFTVDLNGNMISKAADIEGKITATSGNIGGFDVTANEFIGGTDVIPSGKTVGDYVRFSPDKTYRKNLPLGSIDLGIFEHDEDDTTVKDTIIHQRADGYMRVGLTNANADGGNIKFNYNDQNNDEIGRPITHILHSKNFKILADDTVRIISPDITGGGGSVLNETYVAFNTLLSDLKIYDDGMIATYEDAAQYKFSVTKDSKGYITKLTNITDGSVINIATLTGNLPE